MKHWWEADEWGKGKAMEFGKGPSLTARTRRVPLTTEMVPTKDGYALVNRHPHEARTIYVGSITRC